MVGRKTWVKLLVVAVITRAMARAQEFAAFGMPRFPHRLKLFAGDFAAQSKQFRTAALPLTLYAAVFIVVIAVFQMPLRIASAAGHGSYS